jgi:tetratricopeptide (TPR) repeat protein
MMSRSFVHKLLRLHAPLWVVLGVCTIAAPTNAESLSDRICNPPSPTQSQTKEGYIIAPPPPASQGNPLNDPTDPEAPTSYRQQQPSASKPTTALEFYYEATSFDDDSDDQKIAFLNKAIAIAPNYAAAYIARARLYTKQKIYGLAIIDYDRLRQLEPESEIRLLKEKARVYSLSKQWEKLVQIYDKLLVMQSKNVLFIHLFRARAYGELKNWDNAVAAYTQAIALSRNSQAYPDNWSGYEPLPIFSKQSLEPNPSLIHTSSFNKELSFGLESESNDLDYLWGISLNKEALYISRARIYAFQGKKNEAIADYTSAIRISRLERTPFQQSIIYRERCKNYVIFGDLPNARADAQVANKLDIQLVDMKAVPKKEVAEKQVAEIKKVPKREQQIVKKPQTVQNLMEEGLRLVTATSKTDTYQYSNAIDLFTQAIALDRNYAPAYYSRGIAHIKQNNLKSAIEDFSEAIKLNPEFSLAYSARASIYQNNNVLDEAMLDYDRALKTDPTLASANLGRGLILLKQQQWKPAAESFSKTLESDPEMLEALEGRSIARKNLNDLPGSLNDQRRANRLRTP